VEDPVLRTAANDELRDGVSNAMDLLPTRLPGMYDD
jgi:hypothetical protein